VYIVGIKYAAGHLLYFILVDSMPGKDKKLLFSILPAVFGWTYFATQFVACCIYVQFNRQCCETHSTVIICFDTCHIYHMGYMSSAMEATLGLPQLSVRFLADSNGWNVNGTPNLNYETNVQEYWVSRLLNVLFSVGLLKTKFQEPNFLFSSLWQHVPSATENL